MTVHHLYYCEVDQFKSKQFSPLNFLNYFFCFIFIIYIIYFLKDT